MGGEGKRLVRHRHKEHPWQIIEYCRWKQTPIATRAMNISSSAEKCSGNYVQEALIVLAELLLRPTGFLLSNFQRIGSSYAGIHHNFFNGGKTHVDLCQPSNQVSPKRIEGFLHLTKARFQFHDIHSFLHTLAELILSLSWEGDFYRRL